MPMRWIAERTTTNRALRRRNRTSLVFIVRRIRKKTAGTSAVTNPRPDPTHVVSLRKKGAIEKRRATTSASLSSSRTERVAAKAERPAATENARPVSKMEPSTGTPLTSDRDAKRKGIALGYESA